MPKNNQNGTIIDCESKCRSMDTYELMKTNLKAPLEKLLMKEWVIWMTKKIIPNRQLV